MVIRLCHFCIHSLLYSVAIYIDKTLPYNKSAPVLDADTINLFNQSGSLKKNLFKSFSPKPGFHGYSLSGSTSEFKMTKSNLYVQLVVKEDVENILEKRSNRKRELKLQKPSGN